MEQVYWLTNTFIDLIIRTRSSNLLKQTSLRETILQKSDSCKRFCTGDILSLFVIGVMFGFLTNHYKDKFSDSLEDADTFLRRSQDNTRIILVDNFLILERRVLKDLEEGGSTIKAGQVERMGAGALDSLISIVSGLGKVKRKLMDMRDVTIELDAKIAQLIPSWPSAWTARTSSPGSAWPTLP